MERLEVRRWRWLQRIVPLLALIVALLMVSRIPYPHAVTHALRGKESFPRFVGIVLALMALWVVRWYAVPVASAAYALGPPIYHGWTLASDWRRRRSEKAR